MSKRKKLQAEESSSQNDSLNEDGSISVLNDDCLKHIFSFLSFQNRLVLQKVCKRWKTVIPWGGVKSLKLGEKDIVCDAERTSQFSLPNLKKVLGLCGFSITHVELEFFQDKARRTAILKLTKKLCPNLSSLDLSNFELHRQAADFIISNFNKLQAIVIGDSTGADENKISKILSANKSLRSVKFNDSDNLRGICLPSLPLHSIEEFGIFDSEDFSFSNVKKALQKMGKLRSLAFGSNLFIMENIDKLLKAIPDKSNLVCLLIDATLFYYEIGIIQINSLASLTNLRKLNLSGPAVLHDETLTLIGQNCKQLEVAFLSESATLTDVGWKNFSKLKNLKKLKVSELSNLSDECLACLDVSALEVLICCKMNGLTNESLNFLLESAKKLRVLDVAFCQFVKTYTLVKAASAEAESRPKNKVMELRVQINSHLRSVLKNISTNLIVHESGCIVDFFPY